MRVSRFRKAMLCLVAGLTVAACASLVAVLIGNGSAQASVWAAIVAALAGVVAAGAAVWPLIAKQSKVPVRPDPELPEWVVSRPVEVDEVVQQLLNGRARTVGITTGLYGAGGFGKTMLAHIVCADPRVRRRFAGGVYIVTIGRDVRGAAAIAAKVNDLIQLVTGEGATFADPELAGQWLGSLLDRGPHRLLVVDDVWEAEQLAPFVEGGKRCARLATTRVPGLLAGRGRAVLVDQMSELQARELLTHDLPTLDPVVSAGLLAVTGRWPLLLRLVNKILINAANASLTTQDFSASSALLLERLRTAGPTAVDSLLGEPALGVENPEKRALAVRATIEASTSLLSHEDKERFTELAIFAEDETIPFPMVEKLWHVTGGIGPLEASQIRARLADLALLSSAGTGGVSLHDVVRDFLRIELGPNRLRELQQILLEAAAADLPPASPLTTNDNVSGRVSWWELGSDDRYLWDHLIEHLLAAGRLDDAEMIAGDLRWVGARLVRFGPVAPATDLALVGTPQAARRRSALVRAAHLLAPTEPPEAVVDILHSRVADDPDWGPQVAALHNRFSRPRLANRWSLPDLPSLALSRVLVGDTSKVTAVAISPDGSWLATSSGRTVRIWHAATGQARATLTGHTGGVSALAISPDGSWLATSGRWSRTVRIWDATTGQARVTLTGHISRVRALAISPDGSWLATSGRWSRRVRISFAATGRVRIRYDPTGQAQLWDTATGQLRATLTGHTSRVIALAIAPNSTWLATGSRDETVQIWDVATRQVHVTLTGHTGGVSALAISPDSSWLATSSRDETVRIWDAATGQARATLTGHTGGVSALAISPDGSWLATGSRLNRRMWIWDAVAGQADVTLTSHTGEVSAVAIAPYANWLATSGYTGKPVRIWDAINGQAHATMPEDANGSRVLAIAPDASWLATSGYRAEPVRIWDAAIGRICTTLPEDANGSRVLAIAPDASWLATSGYKDETAPIWDATTGRVRIRYDPAGQAQIWDAITGRVRATLTGHIGKVHAVAIAPDGSWLATSSYKDETVPIWNVATWQARAALTGHTGGVRAMAIAPDSSWLATSSLSDTTVRIWDAATGRIRAILTGHGGAVHVVAIAPDSSWLATSSLNDRTVRIWDAATGRIRSILRGHHGGVRAVAIAPDSSWLATSSFRNRTVWIWDATTGRARATLTGHTGGVSALAIAPDSSWLATTGRNDQTVWIWDPRIPQAQACMRVDDDICLCAWLDNDGLAVGGRAGLYVFDFLYLQCSPPKRR